MKYEITIMCHVIAAHEINRQKFDADEITADEAVRAVCRTVSGSTGLYLNYECDHYKEAIALVKGMCHTRPVGFNYTECEITHAFVVGYQDTIQDDILGSRFAFCATYAYGCEAKNKQQLGVKVSDINMEQITLDPDAGILAYLAHKYLMGRISIDEYIEILEKHGIENLDEQIPTHKDTKSA